MDVFIFVWLRNSCEANSVVPDQMTRFAASELGMHCLHMFQNRVPTLKRLVEFADIPVYIPSSLTFQLPEELPPESPDEPEHKLE